MRAMIKAMKKQSRRVEDCPTHQQKLVLQCITFFAVAGWLLLIGYGIYAWDDARFVRESVKDTAEVLKVENRTTNSGEGSDTILYSPTFRFDTDGGQSYAVTPRYDSSRWNFAKGQQITIRYRPDKPERAIPWSHGKSTTFLSAPIPELLILGIGGSFALLGTLGWINLKMKLRCFAQKG